MPFLSALDRNTYFSHKFFTVISNAIVYERDFSRKTNNLYLFFCDVVKELFIVRWSFYMTASKTQILTLHLLGRDFSDPYLTPPPEQALICAV